MLDFETLSLKKNAMLLCCGVVLFDKERESIDRKLWHLDLSEQSSVGRHIDPNTVIWWMQQSTDAQARVFVQPGERVPVSQFLFELSELLFWNDVEAVWCKGPSADAAWLEDICDQYHAKSPVHYRKWRCVRTIEDKIPLGIEMDFGDLVPHDPISDCLAQIRAVRASWSN